MKSPSEALTDISEDPDFCNAINGTHPEDGTAPPLQQSETPQKSEVSEEQQIHDFCAAPAHS